MTRDDATNGPRSAVTVAIDVGPLLGPLTGVGVAVEQMVAALGRRDDVAVAPYACSFRGKVQPGTTRLPLPAAVAQRAWSRSSWPRFDRWLRSAQVVHGTNYTVGPSRLPRVVSVYDCWFLRHPEQASDDVNRAGRVLQRAVDTGATVHASSAATAEAARELLGARRVEVIPLAALPLTTEPTGMSPIAGLEGAPFVLAMGTLERRKNVPRLAAAFGHVAERNHELRLVLAGADGDDLPAIDRTIDALPPAVRGRVMRTGRIDDSTKNWLYSRASVLAYPSLDEGFGFPLLEAMQHEVPVVASTAGSIPEVAGDAALLVDPLDVGALAAAIESVLTDADVAKQLVTAGTARLDHFSWTTTAARLADLYHHLVEEHAR